MRLILSVFDVTGATLSMVWLSGYTLVVSMGKALSTFLQLWVPVLTLGGFSEGMFIEVQKWQHSYVFFL